MKVYGFPISPFVRKVHLVAAEKGIPVELALSNPADPAAEFLAASPFRKIPALIDGDFSLCDSTAIVTYFEALQPEPSLTPGDEAMAEQGLKELEPILAYLEGQCSDGWLTGDEFSIGDIAVAATLRSLGYVGLEPDAQTHPRIAAWYARVKARPSWAPVAALEDKIVSRALGQ